MKICTERLIIRPFESNDIDDVFNIYNNNNTCKYLLHDKWTDENLEKEFNKKLELK